MAFEFFTTQQGVNQNLTDLASRLGAGNNAAVKKKNLEPYKAAKIEAEPVDKQKQFADFLESVKEKRITLTPRNKTEAEQQPVPLEVFTNTQDRLGVIS